MNDFARGRLAAFNGQPCPPDPGTARWNEFFWNSEATWS